MLQTDIKDFPFSINYFTKVIQGITVTKATSVMDASEKIRKMRQWPSRLLADDTYLVDLHYMYFMHEQDLLAFRLAFNV